MQFQNQNQPSPPQNPLPQQNFSPFSQISTPTWQRMKWTHSTVRLLIQTVKIAGDDVVSGEISDQKRKNPSSSPAIQLKKGKWKSVSKSMIEKGFFVSPQQCEDKFNDLNKRYKRLNELLGKENSCKIVENPTVLDSIDFLPYKAKEEIRKILSSKHLFFSEMCAYHMGGEMQIVEEERRHFYGVESEDEEEEEEESEEESLGVKSKILISPLRLSLSSPAKGEEKERMWVKMKGIELEEEGFFYKNRGLQLEKKRFKWLIFRRNKEREMEEMRLKNERVRLENEKMFLVLKEKENRFFESLEIAGGGGGVGGSELKLG